MASRSCHGLSYMHERQVWARVIVDVYAAWSPIPREPLSGSQRRRPAR